MESLFANAVIILIVVLAIGFALRHLYNEKKRGSRCIGCSTGDCCCSGPRRGDCTGAKTP